MGRWFHSPGATKENDLYAADWRDLLLGLLSARQVLSDAERSPASVWMWKEKQDARLDNGWITKLNLTCKISNHRLRPVKLVGSWPTSIALILRNLYLSLFQVLEKMLLLWIRLASMWLFVNLLVTFQYSVSHDQPCSSVLWWIILGVYIALYHWYTLIIGYQTPCCWTVLCTT